MPLPFILAGVAIAAGAYGVKKGVDAKSDFDAAESMNQKAKRICREAENKLNEVREQAQQQMNRLGELKLELYQNTLTPFVNTYQKIKDIDFNDRDIFRKSTLTRESMKELCTTTLQVTDVLQAGVAAIGSGGLAGLAAFGGVGLLATASTGTGIAALSGVAATNATLAWLGGGSLAAGGFGMAGGMAVLGGIVAGPVLAIGGMILAGKAEEARANAAKNIDQAEINAQQIAAAGVATEGITKRFSEIHGVLERLNSPFQPLLSEFQKLVEREQSYRKYSIKEKQLVKKTLDFAVTIKKVMETPLIDKNGVITQESRKILEDGKKFLSEISAAG